MANSFPAGPTYEMWILTRILSGLVIVLVVLTADSMAWAQSEMNVGVPQLSLEQAGISMGGPPGLMASEPTAANYGQRELELYANRPIALSPGLEAEPRSPGLVSPYEATEKLVLGERLFQRPSLSTLPKRLWQDQMNFYSPDSLLLMGVGFGTGAVFANTKLDGDIQRHLQSSLHSANSDEWLESLHANKELGDGRYMLPIYASAWVLGSLLPESELGNRTSVWGERTLRGFVVGVPPVLLLQRVTGSSRPGETATGSEWAPFKDNNGVSGHAFMGALPFITAAKMSDRLGWKLTFYAASTLAPLSRAADGAHYPSQVALGWGLAFLAASAVHTTDNPNARWRILPTASATGSGMALEYKF